MFGMVRSSKRRDPYKPIERNHFHHSIISWINNFPSTKSLLIRSRDILRKHRLYVERRLLSKRYVAEFEVDRLYWVNPKQIEFCSLQEFTSLFKGLILGGDWDKLELKFEEFDVYVSFIDHFERGIPWEETDLFRNSIEKIQNGNYLWNCKNIDDFKQRCKDLDNLYENIKNNGYKTQNELYPGHVGKKDDEICINVGRKGDLLFANGAHRLSIAKILKISNVPVKIVVRHPEWIKFKMQYAKRDRSEVEKNPVSHIDL